MTSSLTGLARQDLHVLLVEDDPGDVMLVRESFDHHKILNPLDVVSDGVEALAFLRQEKPFGEAARPALIMLDLNLPKMDGREVLAEIKSDPVLRSIPVVVLTTSAADEDIVQQIDEFFISVVQLPR